MGEKDAWALVSDNFSWKRFIGSLQQGRFLDGAADCTARWGRRVVGGWSPSGSGDHQRKNLRCPFLLITFLSALALTRTQSANQRQRGERATR